MWEKETQNWGGDKARLQGGTGVRNQKNPSLIGGHTKNHIRMMVQVWHLTRVQTRIRKGGRFARQADFCALKETLQILESVPDNESLVFH
jgi:hypothetical protein